MSIAYRFYAIVDDQYVCLSRMPSFIEQLLLLNITCVQLRVKSSAPANFIAVARACLAILKPRQIPLIINDSLDVMINAEADGVHLGQSDLDCRSARSIVGTEKIIGLSIETVEQAKQCRDYPVDYFGVGAVFTTQTKIDVTQAIGLARLKEINALLAKPVVAIGGINFENFQEVLQIGVAGVVMVSALTRQFLPRNDI